MTPWLYSQAPVKRPFKPTRTTRGCLRGGPGKTKVQRFPSAAHSSDAAADRNSVPRRCGPPKNRASTCAMQWASWVEHVHGAPANWFVRVMAPALCHLTTRRVAAAASSDTSAGARQLIVPRRLLARCCSSARRAATAHFARGPHPVQCQLKPADSSSKRERPRRCKPVPLGPGPNRRGTRIS